MKKAKFKMGKLDSRLRLKGKLILFVGSVLVAVMLAQFALSYIALDRTHNESIQATNDAFDSVIKSGVQNMVGVLEVNYKRFTDGEITEKEAMDNAKKIVRDTRYNNGEGYYWADMEDGTCVVHLNPEYEGTNRYDLTDVEGNYLVQNLIAAGNNPEGGFTDFYFTKPGEEGSFLKRAYTMKFEPYGWYISTGNYNKDIAVYIEQKTQQKYIGIIAVIIANTITFLIGMLLVSIFAKTITKPLGKLTERLQLVSEGDLNTPVPVVNSHDETNMLSKATENTVDQLHRIIDDITYHLEKMSDGDMTSRVTMEYTGDFLPIKQALVKIHQSLNGTLSDINQAAEQVNSGAEQVSVGAQTLASGATEQASVIEELSASITEVSEQASKNATNVRQATGYVNQSVTGVDESNEYMKNMLVSMKEISDASDEISKIIKVIDDIAFQTNILALNAAVEAARAGASGKGFAVVADEVRNLASKSAEAAKQTAVLINTSAKAVTDGSKIAEDTAKALDDVSAKSRRAKEVMVEIESASVAQASAISQITQGIEQISSVVQNNAATAEESSAASEELSSQSSILRYGVAKFKLLDSSAKQPSSRPKMVRGTASTEHQYIKQNGSDKY
ncbi:methyl-accepting chemotaxis protein [Oscillospiraceae bacterium PP1C4]